MRSMADRDPKLRTLQQHGTVNPRPKAVRDELFLQDEFFDPRDLVQVKYEMLRRVRTDGKSVTDAATNFGFSRPSFYQAQSAFEQDGLAGLVPRKRGPKQAPSTYNWSFGVQQDLGKGSSPILHMWAMRRITSSAAAIMTGTQW